MRSDSEDLDGEEDLDADLLEDADLSDASGGDDVVFDDRYAKTWASKIDAASPVPGGPGFQSFASEALRTVLLQRKEDTSTGEGNCPPPQLHQDAIAFLLHPRSPVKRLLVDQPTGAGKTREMIAVLDQFFCDRRPKVPVFPRAAVCRNFYEELLRWPNHYRDFFSCLQPRWAALAAGLQETGDWRLRRRDRWPMSHFIEAEIRVVCGAIREVLEMKTTIIRGRFRRGFRAQFRARYPECLLPGAPLRALSYASAGGSYAALGADGQPLSALLKIMYPGTGSVYSNKVVILDEAHNLIRTQTKYGEQLCELRRQLESARDSVVAAFTGTPIPDDPSGGRRLLAVVKGLDAQDHSDEGYMASLTVKRPPLFPSTFPRGVPDALLTAARQRRLSRKFVLSDHALKQYELKCASGLPNNRLQSYCNSAMYCTGFHGHRKRMALDDSSEYMPKLAAIASAICRRREKAAVLVTRQGGYMAMLALLRRMADNAVPPFGVASGERLAEFNAQTNARGEHWLVLVAEGTQFSEGTSFRAVRRLYLGDVPASASAFQQQCGRAARMFGHEEVPLEERVVSFVMPIAVVPTWMRCEFGAWSFRAFCTKSSRPDVAIQSARTLRKKLRARGITTLAHVKMELDRISRMPHALTVCTVSGVEKDKLSREALWHLFQQWDLEASTSSQRDDSGGRRRSRGGGCRGAQGAKPTSYGRALRPLAHALQCLRSTGVEGVVETLPIQTADEIALQKLVDGLSEQVPALTKLRVTTLDCDVDVDKDNENDQSDAESLIASDWEVEALPKAGLQYESSDEEVHAGANK